MAKVKDEKMATEIELKLSIAPENVSAFEACAMVAVATLICDKKFENSYFDTPDLVLHKKKMALRIRNTGTALVQTVKCASASVNGLSIRPEWEYSYGGAFDFSGVSDQEISSFLNAVKADLVPLFKTDFHRKTWEVQSSDGATIHIMLDVGTITARNKTTQISEVELELVKGNVEELKDFAAQLCLLVQLEPSDVSKAERGFDLWVANSSR